MNYRIIDENIKVHLSIQQYSEELFLLTDKNRDFLEEWLPWLGYTKTLQDTKSFIDLQLRRYAKNEALHQCIFYNNELAGVIGFNGIKNGLGIVVYWLAEEYNGLGIMSKCVKELLQIGFEELNLEKIEIYCATHNLKSQAIPKRLGFKEETVIKNAEKLNGKYYDQILFSINQNMYK